MIITLNRQFGSGGREIGRKVADALNVPFYDKNIVSEIARRSGLHPDYIEENSESFIGSMKFANIARSFTIYQETIPMQIQIEQHNIIEELGKDNTGVFVGRRADYVFQEKKPFKVFIYSSDINKRIERCMEHAKKHPEENSAIKTEKEFEKEILKLDDSRRRYYEMYTDLKWEHPQNYNLCIDTARINIDDAVEIIKNTFVKLSE